MIGEGVCTGALKVENLIQNIGIFGSFSPRMGDSTRQIRVKFNMVQQTVVVHSLMRNVALIGEG